MRQSDGDSSESAESGAAQGRKDQLKSTVLFNVDHDRWEGDDYIGRKVVMTKHRMWLRLNGYEPQFFD